MRLSDLSQNKVVAETQIKAQLGALIEFSERLILNGVFNESVDDVLQEMLKELMKELDDE